MVEKKQEWLIDVAIPGDSRIAQKNEKITKYQNMKVEVERFRKKKATVVPVMIGVLEATPRSLTRSHQVNSEKQHCWEQLTSCEHTF